MYVKINGNWSIISYIYQRNNEAWVQINESELHQYINQNIGIYGGHTRVRILSIYSQEVVIAETCQCLAYEGSTELSNVGTWSIVSGNSYASINQNGEITINSNANNSNITVRFDYDGLHVEKQINLTYLSGSSSTTEVEVIENQDGTTTTTTTSTTENQDGSSTSNSTSNTYDENGNITQTTETTITDDGNGNTTNTSTTTNQDGSSSSTEIINNADGTSSESNTTTTAPDENGSITTTGTTVNYDSNGDVTGSQSSEITENQDGSSSSTITNYDSNGDPTDTTNNTIDTDGNSNTQDIEYDNNGDPIVTGYTIDTSGNTSGTGEAITGEGVETGFYPFDGSTGFEMHIRFYSRKQDQPNPPIVTDTEDTGSNYHFTILASKDPYSPWPGFHIRWTLAKKNYSSGSLYFGYKGTTGSSANRALSLSKHDDMYDFTVSYDPQLKKYPSKFRCQDNLNGGATISLNIDFNPLDYGFTLGYNINQQGQPYRYSNVTIHEFSITKI